MARIGSTITKTDTILDKIEASNKVKVLYVHHATRHENTRLVPRSGKRVGNDVYFDMIYIPVSVDIQILEDQSTRTISLGFLGDKLFTKYLDGEISLSEYYQQNEIDNQQKQTWFIVGLTFFVIVVIICLIS